MERDPHSHKGLNGKVAVIGGSRYIHGAPLLAALAVEASGVDLVYVRVPECHADVAKSTALNFQVVPFEGDNISKKDIEPTLEMLAIMDVAVVGPGVIKNPEQIAVLEEIIDSTPCPLVLDAAALQEKTIQLTKGKPVVLTPHRGELERMGITPEQLSSAAMEHEITMLLKGATDQVAGKDGRTEQVQGGNAGLIVGGTGDALAGLIAGLMAQNVDAFDASVMAPTILKRAGALLFEEMGFAYTAMDVIRQIPYHLHTYDQANG